MKSLAKNYYINPNKVVANSVVRELLGMNADETLVVCAKMLSRAHEVYINEGALSARQFAESVQDKMNEHYLEAGNEDGRIIRHLIANYLSDEAEKIIASTETDEYEIEQHTKYVIGDAINSLDDSLEARNHEPLKYLLDLLSYKLSYFDIGKFNYHKESKKDKRKALVEVHHGKAK